MMYKILIIEDEEVTALALDIFLTSLGYMITDCVNCADDAYKSVELEMPDLIISDIMIKGQVSGSELSKELYIKYKIPIVFLTAYCSDEMLDYAIDAHAYGYIVKPYKEEELKATLKLALYHANCEPKQNSSMVIFDTFIFDLSKRHVIQDTKIVKLGKKSLKLLEILLHNINQPIPNETLMQQIYEEYNEHSLDNLRHLVKRTKARLKTNSISSHKNMGYSISNI